MDAGIKGGSDSLSKDKKEMYPSDSLSSNPWIGSHVSKEAKSVLVCCKCHTQVIISGFTDRGMPIYQCTKDTCPAFGKERNRIQREWIEYDPKFFYLTSKVI